MAAPTAISAGTVLSKEHQLMRFIRTAVVAGVSLATLIGVGVGTAHADPTSTPSLSSIVGVGSDTTTPLYAGSPNENVAGSLTYDYDNQTPAPSDLWYSWDAVNPSTGATGDEIITKGSSSTDTTCEIARPDGSSAGITALEANTQDDGSYCIDYARSSRAPNSTDPTDIVFVPFAGDAIAWASPAGTSSDPSPVPSTLTLADLQGIYSCSITNWSTVGGSSAPIVPVLPQSGSGTRATFLLDLGSDGTPLTPGTCVVNGTNSTGNIEENTGLSAPNVAQFDPSGVPAVDDVVPYSIGDFLAQGTAANGVGGHASDIWGHGVLTLGDLTNSSGTVEAPTTTNSSSQAIINTSYPYFQRDLYNVVRNADTAPTLGIPTYLQPIFSSTGFLCSSSTAKADEISYGFYQLGRNCGSLIDG
jgi:ABC-type phosphate transport system substrate-binding protein